MDSLLMLLLDDQGEKKVSTCQGQKCGGHHATSPAFHKNDRCQVVLLYITLVVTTSNQIKIQATLTLCRYAFSVGHTQECV